LPFRRYETNAAVGNIRAVKVVAGQRVDQSDVAQKFVLEENYYIFEIFVNILYIFLY
jgi:hypothetical protein